MFRLVEYKFSDYFRPLSAPHDLMQLCGRGGRGPDVFSSTLEVIWNNNDISTNVPGKKNKNKSCTDCAYDLHFRHDCFCETHIRPEWVHRTKTLQHFQL